MGMGGFFYNKHNFGGLPIVWGGGCKFLVEVKLDFF